MHLIALRAALVLSPPFYKMCATHVKLESIRPIQRMRYAPSVRPERTPLRHPLRRVNLAQLEST